MKPQSSPPKAHAEIEIVRLLWLAIFVSVFSFLYYYRNGDLLLCGDAVAHINIARRVFDSRTPGLLQLGTVWLPLPHLLIIPFIVSNRMWQSGAGGSMPSMAAFALSVLGIFRLVGTVLGPDGEGQYAAKLGAWAAAILYLANPNLIFLQATAMGEALYLAFFIWAVAFVAESYAETLKSAHPMRAVSCGGVFNAIRRMVSGGRSWCSPQSLSTFARNSRTTPTAETASSPSRASILKFVLIAGAAPVLWLAYNAAVYRNPLEFANGPYSAKAIEQTATVNPAEGQLGGSGIVFLKAAELNVSESTWEGRLWLALALLGSLSTWLRRRARAALLLWIPLPFYTFSVAYGSVPIFVPPWWPFSIYNARYGLQLLPAFAVFVPMGICFLVQSAMKIPSLKAWRLRWRMATTVLGILLLAVSSYAAIWRANPICYREAVNMKARFALDRQLGEWMKNFPPNSTLLMYLGGHVGALEQAGIPLRRTINEGNHRVWVRPSDPGRLVGACTRRSRNLCGLRDWLPGRSRLDCGA